MRVFLTLIVLAAVFPSTLFSEAAGSATATNKGFVTIKEILENRCSACHDWTGSWESITGGGRIVPGSPEKSALYQKIADDSMPAEGDKLTPDQKAFIRGWIAAGAPDTDLPIAVPGAETTTAASPAPAASQGFLFFPNKVVFHEVTGFASTALFMGAGIIGVVHFLNMMSEGHKLRDAAGFDEDGPESVRKPLVIEAWKSDSDLRWWHVGLIAAGETLYIGDAITGLSMLTSSTPGKITKRDIHRYAFFTHVTLMAAEIVLGFFTTDALSRGEHDTVIALGAAHAGIGVAIPLVMLGAGLENMLLPE
jgi:hypothetical protein